jgi:hypothetical protein
MNVMVCRKNEARGPAAVDRSRRPCKSPSAPRPVCDKCHSNAELTVVGVFQAAFAEEKRYVDVDQVRCIFGTYRGHHRTDGFALFDNSIGCRGRAVSPPGPKIL